MLEVELERQTSSLSRFGMLNQNCRVLKFPDILTTDYGFQTPISQVIGSSLHPAIRGACGLSRG